MRRPSCLPRRFAVLFSLDDWPSVDHMAMTVFYCAQ